MSQTRYILESIGKILFNKNNMKYVCGKIVLGYFNVSTIFLRCCLHSSEDTDVLKKNVFSFLSCLHSYKKNEFEVSKKFCFYCF